MAKRKVVSEDVAKSVTFLCNSENLPEKEIAEILKSQPVGLTHICESDKESKKETLVALVDITNETWPDFIPTEFQCFRCKFSYKKEWVLFAVTNHSLSGEKSAE